MANDTSLKLQVAFNLRPKRVGPDFVFNGRIRMEDHGGQGNARVFVKVPVGMMSDSIIESIRALPETQERTADNQLVRTGTYLLEGTFEGTTRPDQVAYETENGVGGSVWMRAVAGTELKVISAGQAVSVGETLEALFIAGALSKAASDRLGNKAVSKPNGIRKAVTVQEAADKLGVNLGEAKPKAKLAIS